MGSICLGKRQYGKAITWRKQAVALSPNDSDRLALLAITLGNADKLEEAILYFKKAIRLNPFSPAWYFQALGGTYRRAGQYDDSIKAAKRALSINPKIFLPHLILIASYSHLGRISETKAAVKEFLSLYPEFKITESFEKAFFDKNRAHIDALIADLRRAGLK